MRIATQAKAMPMEDSPASCFADPNAFVRGWYVMGCSRRLWRGQVRSVSLARRHLVVWRDTCGNPHAMDGRCAQSCADLSQGRVEGNRLRCAFHGWCYDQRGRCVATPGNDEPLSCALRGYPVAERFGLLWLFADSEATFALPTLPEGESEHTYRRLLLPAQHLNCHTHLVIGNGLDPHHFDALHGMERHRCA